MGVTTIQQSQSSNKQSSKDLHQGGRRGSRSGSSSASAASSLSSNVSPTKKTSPPSKFTSQLRKLRKRSSNNNNNQTSPQSSSGRQEKKLKRDEESAAEARQKTRDTSPEVKRKHQKVENKSSEGEGSRTNKVTEKREDGVNKLEKHDKEKDLKHSSTTSSNKNSSISSNTTENANSSSNNNIKNRPPVKLTVKFNKSEGGSKKPCQVQVVNSSLSVLPTISSSTSSGSEEKVETDNSSMSPPSATIDTSAGTSINKSIKGKSSCII